MINLARCCCSRLVLAGGLVRLGGPGGARTDGIHGPRVQALPRIPTAPLAHLVCNLPHTLTCAFVLIFTRILFIVVAQGNIFVLRWYDSSKQGVAAALVHFANVVLAVMSSDDTPDNDPCTW